MERYEYYKNLNKLQPLEIRIEKVYEKWTPFKDIITTDFMYKKDIIHRSVLDNEIVIDLDKPDIKDNETLLKDICKKLDKKGLKYVIYYSGGKGFHIHILFNKFEQLFTKKDIKLKEKLEEREFVPLCRMTIIKWIGIKVEDIDMLLIKSARRLIRAEGSLHHKGNYKTYIGDYKGFDLNNYKSSTDYIMDKHKVKDRLNYITPGLYLRFIENIKEKLLSYKASKVYFEPNKTPKLRNIVEKLLNKPIEDGRKLILFILLRELKANNFTKEQAKQIIKGWNELKHREGRLKLQVLYSQIEYAYNNKVYPLKTDTINEYIKQVVFLP